MLHTSSSPTIPVSTSVEGQERGSNRDQPIGQLLSQSIGLQPAQVEQILEYQRRYGGRFGEAALAMGLASEDDILEVLAWQFGYPYLRKCDEGSIEAELVCACDPLGEDAHSFQELRSELLAGVLNAPQPRALAVLSPQAGDGRSYVAANLALAFAQLGGRTLLVDADMRSPRQHALFGIDDSYGLSKLLCGSGAVRQFMEHPARFPGLFVLGAGPIPPNPLELLQRPGFGRLCREWTSNFDYVVIDTPAASCGPDARVIAAAAGAALMVARPQVARMSDLERLVSAIQKGPATLAGVVMNEH